MNKKTILQVEANKLFPGVNSEKVEFDRYKELTQIGEGGLSRVYKAYDSKLGRHVALKILKKGIAANRKVLDRFRQEITLQAKLNITGCTKIYDCGEENGLFYCVLEYIDGKSLDLIISESSLQLEDKIKILLRVTEIIREIHSRGFEHRDIKPANIIIDKNNSVFILDFGLAKAVNEKTNIYHTAYGDFFGTPAYMSPEQTDTKLEMASNFKSDIYSLGMTAYQLLTGHLPYDIDLLTQEEVFYIIKNEKPRPLKTFNTAIPDSLEKIILKSLEKSPQNRPSIDDFHETLSALLKNKKEFLYNKIFYLLTISALVIITLVLFYSHFITEKSNDEKINSISEPVKNNFIFKDLSKIKNAGFPPVKGLAEGSEEAQLNQKEELKKTGFPLEVETKKYKIKMRFIPTGSIYNSKGKVISIDTPFYIGVFEITKAQWNEIMNSDNGKENDKDLSFPVNNISWNDCQIFLKKLCLSLNVSEDLYRLPTVKEWEYAASAGSSTDFYFGSAISAVNANYYGRFVALGQKSNFIRKTTMPGSYRPNAFGLYDTIGNVSEWCEDNVIMRPYSQEILPGLCNDSQRIVKGGSWIDKDSHCSLSSTEYQNEDTKSSTIGFRIVREIVQK